MQGTTLEIKVFDTIIIAETFEEAIAKFVELVKTWFYDENDNTPLTITLTKVHAQAPPILFVNVNDSIGVASGLV